MMSRALPLLLLGFLWIALSSDASAKALVADLDSRLIEIDSGFTGQDLLLFGARNNTGDVVVIVRGPAKSYMVRKRESIGGIWVNRHQLRFDNVPGFYFVASNRTMDDIKNYQLLSSLNIGTEILSFQTEKEANSKLKREFHHALLSEKEVQKLYTPTVKGYHEVSFIGDTLFRTIIRFPENIPRGSYTAEVYLFNDGQLSAVQSTPIIVKKTGFDAFVSDLAYQHSALYGIIGILLALGAGWGANHLFEKKY
jgi:uncharacterized protein (TIGR02186 family)